MVNNRWSIPLFCLVGCFHHAEVPETKPDAAALGRCGGTVEQSALCGEWSDAVDGCEGDADDHASFPELDPVACYVPVRYTPGSLPRADATPAGCGYPGDRAAVLERLDAEVKRYDAIAGGDVSSLPMALDCSLPEEVRAAAARSNARTLRTLVKKLSSGRSYPYAAASTFGYGHPVMSGSALVDWRPQDACMPLDKREMDRLSINRKRAGRAAEAYHGGVAPVVTVSGGAVHATLYEAFMLHHLASCTFDVPRDAVMLDPCADHTHTNLRNTGGLVIALGGRTAYVVTSDKLQAKYLQEWSVFSLIGGSIDARSLRDWGYLLGSWRQASVGIDAGFWFTPYRFWGEPHDALGGAACVR